MTANSIDQLTLRSIQNGVQISDRYAILVREHFLRHTLEPYTEEHKFFFEEFQPATIVAEYYGLGFQLQFGGKQKRIDCRLQKNGGEMRLEMIFAVDGQDERIKWEHYKKYGHLSVFQDVNYVGNKRNRQIEEQISYKATRWNESQQKIYNLVESCIRKKVLQAESRPLYANSILVVTINDYSFPVSVADQRFRPVFSRASAKFSSILPFNNFLGLCWSGKCIFDRAQQRSALLNSEVFASVQVVC